MRCLIVDLRKKLANGARVYQVERKEAFSSAEEREIRFVRIRVRECGKNAWPSRLRHDLRKTKDKCNVGNWLRVKYVSAHFRLALNSET